MLYGREHIGFWLESRPGRGRVRVTMIWKVDGNECGIVVFLSFLFAFNIFRIFSWLSVYRHPQAHPLSTVMLPAQAQVRLATHPNRYRYRALKLPR